MQYLSKKELNIIIGEIQLKDFTLLSQDTYSDTDIGNAIKSTGMSDELACSAVQLAIIGFGNKNFGSFNYRDKKIDIKKLFEECGVNINYGLGSKLNPSDLTPRRIVRFFRYHIDDYLMSNKNIAPYLWRKYSTRDEHYRCTTFPGAESCIINKNECLYLIETYRTLDARLGLNITERVLRVLLARNVVELSDLTQLH